MHRRFALTHLGIEFNTRALCRKSTFTCCLNLAAHHLGISHKPHLFFLGPGEHSLELFYPHTHFFVGHGRSTGQAFDKRSDASANPIENSTHRGYVLGTLGVVDGLFNITREASHLWRGHDALHRDLHSLECSFGTTKLAREFFFFAANVGDVSLNYAHLPFCIQGPTLNSGGEDAHRT